jgi:hypothetical protein
VCDTIQLFSTVANAMNPNTFGIVVVGDYLYWGNGAGKVVSMRNDGVPNATFGNGSDSIYVAADANRVYYSDWNDGKIRAATLDPSHLLADVTSVAPSSGSAPASRFGHVALRQGILYGSVQSPNEIWTAPSNGSQGYATQVVSKVDDSMDFDVSGGVAVDDTHVYWTDANTVLRIPLSQIGNQQAIEPPVAKDQATGDVAVDDTWVFWTDASGIAWKPKTGGGNGFSVYSSNRGRGLLLDGEYVYWSVAGSTANPSSQILRAKKGGDATTVTVVAESPPGAYALAADCGAIYWTTFDVNILMSGSVQKVRKPD